MSEPAADLVLDGRHVLYTTMSLVFQTMFYGIYVVLMPISVHILLKRGSNSRSRLILLAAIFFPFILSSLYWAAQVAVQVNRINVYFIHPERRHILSINHFQTIFNAIILLNFIFTDGVAVWRAWVLCKSEYKKILFVPITFLILTSLSIFATIGIRTATYFTAAGPNAPASNSLINVLNIFQVSNYVWSFLTNLTSTAVISHKTWRHRLLFKAGLANMRNKSTRAERIMALLIESGILYCVSGATVLIATLIPLPFDTLGDVYTPISIQIAGIYPTIIIVLVGLERTLNNTTFWNDTSVVAVEAGTSDEHGQSTSGNQNHRISRIQFARDSSECLETTLELRESVIKSTELMAP